MYYNLYKNDKKGENKIMSQFTYSQYVSNTPSNYGAKIGWFSLKNDGDTALVRFNCSTIDDLYFATVHSLTAGGRFMKVNCLSSFNGHGDDCPFCRAAAAGNASIGKTAKKVFIEMMVSYKDKTTNTYSAPIPVIWERPAGFAGELKSKLANYGNLKESLFTITRAGAAGSRDTRYSIDYAIPTVFKPEMIPNDFSVFNDFDISKKGYYTKTAAEMEAYLNTGSFPERNTQNNITTSVARDSDGYVNLTAPTASSSTATQFANVDAYNPPIERAAQNSETFVAATSAVATSTAVPAPTAVPIQTAEAPKPERKFGGFSF